MSSLRYGDIDGLRAVAILTVLLYHSEVGVFTGGFVGVDVFFVISGYLITRQIHHRMREDGGGLGTLLLWFYARRIRRLLPAFLFISAITGIVGFFVYLPNQMEQLARSMLYASFFVGNMYFSQRSYFDPDSSMQPLLHYWSLGVEVQFYLLFPLVLYVAWKYMRGWVTVALMTLAILSLAAAEAVLAARPSDAFYWLPFRAWELLAGALVALPSMPLPRKSWIGGAVVTVGIALIYRSRGPIPMTCAFQALPHSCPVLGLPSSYGVGV